MGQYPITEERGFAGGTIRFLHGAVSSRHTLQLGFIALTQTEAKSLRDHYRSQQGGFLAFALSAEAWAGHSSMTDLVPSTTLWRYVQPPEETHGSGGLVNMTIQIESCIT